jgi:hypothetical protein
MPEYSGMGQSYKCPAFEHPNLLPVMSRKIKGIKQELD